MFQCEAWIFSEESLLSSDKVKQTLASLIEVPRTQAVCCQDTERPLEGPMPLQEGQNQV